MEFLRISNSETCHDRGTEERRAVTRESGHNKTGCRRANISSAMSVSCSHQYEVVNCVETNVEKVLLTKAQIARPKDVLADKDPIVREKQPTRKIL